MRSLLMMRHGDKETSPTIDPPLSQTGHCQTAQSGLCMTYSPDAKMLDHADLLVSPYKRTIETAIITMAVRGWSGETPKLILEPRLGETLSNERCIGSERAELLEWLKDENGLNRSMQNALLNIIQQSIIPADQFDTVRRRMLALIANIDKSTIENGPEKWWPTNGSGTNGFERASDVKHRINAVRTAPEYATGALAFFTHSTVIADSFSEFQVEFGEAASASRGPQTWPALNVPLAGVFYLEASCRDLAAPLIMRHAHRPYYGLG